jgi:hypothetical protein
MSKYSPKESDMAPNSTDPVLVVVGRLEDKVDDLRTRVAAHERQLRWIVSAAALLVGVIGGPEAVQLVTAA